MKYFLLPIIFLSLASGLLFPSTNRFVIFTRLTQASDCHSGVNKMEYDQISRTNRAKIEKNWVNCDAATVKKG